jgi:GTP cyclohydrolase I
VDTMARRFIIQEDLTSEIAEQVTKQINSVPVRVVTTAQIYVSCHAVIGQLLRLCGGS